MSPDAGVVSTGSVAGAAGGAVGAIGGGSVSAGGGGDGDVSAGGFGGDVSPAAAEAAAAAAAAADARRRTFVASRNLSAVTVPSSDTAAISSLSEAAENGSDPLSAGDVEGVDEVDEVCT